MAKYRITKRYGTLPSPKEYFTLEKKTLWWWTETFRADEYDECYKFMNPLVYYFSF